MNATWIQQKEFNSISLFYHTQVVICRVKVNPFLPFRLSESTGVIVGTVVDEEGALFNMDVARGAIGALVRRTDGFLVYYLQDLCGSAQ